MKIEKSDKIPEILLITPGVKKDHRGYFAETYNQKKLSENGVNIKFIQDNESFSSKNVLRGIHFQAPRSQTKLVRVLTGAVFDVAVDLRVGSPTFGKWVAAILTEENFAQLLVPQGFGHGFVVMSDKAKFSYKVDDFWYGEDERSLRWDDSTIGIEWIAKSAMNYNPDEEYSDWELKDPILSDKDSEDAKSFEEIAKELQSIGGLYKY